MTQLWLSVSTDSGRTWGNRLVLDTAELDGTARGGGTLGHLLVASAIDSRGMLYAAFARRAAGATRTTIELVRSADRGATWSSPVTVGAPTRSNVMPALAVSRSGVAYLSWYGSNAADFRDPAARWVEMVAATSNPKAMHPTFVISQVSGATPVHVGGIDAAGAVGSDLGDNWGLRDFQSIAVDRWGRPHPVWGVDFERHATQTAEPLAG
jgi:hypothetical protein